LFVLELVKLLRLASLQLTLGLVGAEAIGKAEFRLYTFKTGHDRFLRSLHRLSLIARILASFVNTNVKLYGCSWLPTVVVQA